MHVNKHIAVIWRVKKRAKSSHALYATEHPYGWHFPAIYLTSPTDNQQVMMNSPNPHKCPISMFISIHCFVTFIYLSNKEPHIIYHIHVYYFYVFFCILVGKKPPKSPCFLLMSHTFGGQKSHTLFIVLSNTFKLNVILP